MKASDYVLGVGQRERFSVHGIAGKCAKAGMVPTRRVESLWFSVGHARHGLLRLLSGLREVDVHVNSRMMLGCELTDVEQDHAESQVMPIVTQVDPSIT